jgi:hypothetical protein
MIFQGVVGRLPTWADALARERVWSIAYRPLHTAIRAATARSIFAEALQLIEEAETRLRALLDGYVREADHEAVNQFMVEAHLQHWGSRADPAQDSRCYLRTMA